tara:strand:- start:306 stop:1382 length:1077 start_codon:yes stop_codon:yes gene_type:complete
MSEVTKVNISSADVQEPKKTDDVYKVDLKEINEKAEVQPEETEQPAEEQAASDGATPVLQEVLEEVTETENISKSVEEPEPKGRELPEGVEKLLSFMEETGGTLEDYSKLNKDYSSLSENEVLAEYYKQTKPHLDDVEVEFLIEDNFDYDEDIDEDVDVKRKRLAKKEAVADAKKHLDKDKNKYYQDLKAGSRLTEEQKKAVDFFDRYNKESEENAKVAEGQVSNFLNKTTSLFSNEFKGFEFNIGEKKFRYNVKDVSGVKDTQSDINNFVGKFLDESGNMNDAKGYHKSLFTAMNADAIANHFYEQGKADALKTSISKSKNINMDPRSSSPVSDFDGVKVRVLGGSSSSKLRMKTKN